MLAFMPWTPRSARCAATEDDSALAARVAAGDARALDALYRRDADAVYRYALALAGNPAWAADATQDAFIAFTQYPQGFDAALGSLAAYLAGMARHRLLRIAREAPPATTEADDDDDATTPSTPVTPESLLVARQDGATLWAALRGLPWAQREALVLVDVQQWSYAAAAAIAGIPLNTLRTRLHRARLGLAAALDPAGMPRPTGDPT